MVPSEQGVRLLVEPAIASAARHQLHCFERESVDWPPRPLESWPGRPVHLVTPLLWSLMILAAFRGQELHPSLTAAGALDASAMVARGEWWRAATALFLHADLGHVLSNGIAGIFVFSAVTTTFGIRRGWLLVGAAAAIANLFLARYAMPASYVSLGASTAIFAGLGGLSGRAARFSWHQPLSARWKSVLVPVGAGATLLALFGAGEFRVDVGAHLAGFLAGFAFGAALAGPAAGNSR
jgi:rhomboid protease GluP